MKLRNTVFLIAACALLVMAYIVQKGDTLWDLSEEYLKDPFAWQDLWKANPHIQDPHWIYPGDSICFPGQGPCPVVSRGEGQQHQHAAEETESVAKGNNTQGHNAGGGSGRDYRAPERPKSFNPYYQRLMPVLESVGPKDEKSSRGWYRVYNDEANRPIIHSMQHEVLLGYGKKAFPKLKAGDFAEIWSSRKVSVPNDAGTSDEYYLRQLAGLAKVTGVGDSLSRATILQSFSMITMETAISRPQRSVKTIDVKGFKPVKRVKASDMAEVVLFMDKSIVPSLYSYILIDMGKERDYVPGSAVAFWDMDKRDPTIPPRLLGRGLVVYSDKSRSTVLIRDLYNATRRIDVGTPVSLTHQPVM